MHVQVLHLFLLSVTPIWKGGVIMVLSADKKRVAFSLTTDDVEKLKEIYLNDSRESESRIYESDTLSKLINYVFEMEQKGKSEWRK